MKEYYNHSLLPYNTFGMNVQAARFIEYESVDELIAVLPTLKNQPVLHIGGGSNLLFAGDYQGVILHSAIKSHEITDETDEYVELRVGAGVVWDDFVAYTVKNGWYGAENLSLIPGEVGASAVQNIGAYGIEAKDLITRVETIERNSLSPRSFTNKECGYGYRQSIFKQELKGKYIVTYVTYRLGKIPAFRLDYGNIRSEIEKEGCEATLENIRRIIIRIRQSKLPDPKILGNAGSFFMNPVIPVSQFNELLRRYPGMPHYKVDEMRVKIPAGWMIEQCGWKGKSIGNAAVHDKQALVLVNRGGATGKDLIRLAEDIVNSVKERFGISIHPEVNFICHEDNSIR